MRKKIVLPLKESFFSNMASSSPAPPGVMLAIHEKKTIPVDLYRPLRNYITSHYSEREAQLFEDDLQTVRQLRSDIEKPPESSPPDVRRDTLQAYARALALMEPRFPISPDRAHINTITFTWFDAFKPNKKAAQQSIHLEKAAVLFNLGAVYSQMGLAADRSSPSGLKQACNCFQAAVGAFAFLRDNVSMKALIGGSTVDVSAECAGMLERLMLGQAQECYLEKVISDAKQPGLCSKVARQVGLYYEEAYAALSVPPLSQHFDRTWICHVQLKAAQFYAEACYRNALELHGKEEIAEEIARLKIGLGALTDAKKSSKGVAAPLLDAISRLENNMNLSLERAVKENERVYLMRVPAASSLKVLPAASLVKPVPMADVLDASKDKLFSTLVPDSSTKALSKYTEMVDDIIRTQAEKLQQGSEITRVKLREMDLPDFILALEGKFSLPLDLKEDVEAVQISGGPSGLDTDQLQRLRDSRSVNQELLVQTEELLQKEAREDAQFRTQFGTRWTRPQSSTLTKNLQDILNRFAGNLKQATDSDARIERAVRDNMELMSILDHRPIDSALPSLARSIMSLDRNEEAIVGALKQSLWQLQTLATQRAGLEDMLKEMKRKDDILPKLLTSAWSNEDLFKKEISKYDLISEEIAQNIEAQEQLLLQIQAQNDDFAAVFNLEDYKVSRDRCYTQIAAAIAKYREINDNINEGLKFYVKLQDSITNVKQQCSDFVITRNIQCREMIEDVRRQMAGLNFAADAKAGYNYSLVGQSQSNPQRNVPRQPDPQSSPHASHQQPPYTQPSREPPRPGFYQSYVPYASSQQPPYYAAPAAPYQHPPHEYGQPAYPGWHRPYYNAPPQQQGPYPPPPDSLPGQYPQQGSYNKHQ